MTNISQREKEVLELISQEYSAREIADMLFISFHTANSHRKNIMHKLNVKNTAGMIRAGFETGLLSLKSSKLH